MMVTKSERVIQLRAVMAALLAGEAINRDTEFEGVRDKRVSEVKSRICELRSAGWPILTVYRKGERFCRYVLVGAGRRTEAGRDER